MTVQLDLVIILRVICQASPHGVALAMMARRKIPDLKVLFIGRPEQQEHTDGIGEFMPAPISMPELVSRLLVVLAE